MGGHHVMIDGGAGHGDDRGPTPMSLVAAALAGCTAMDVISILRKERQPVNGLVVRVAGEQSPDHPRRYTRLEVTYEVHGEGLDRRAIERAVALSSERYCSVQATLQDPPQIDQQIEIVAASEGPRPS